VWALFASCSQHDAGAVLRAATRPRTLCNVFGPPRGKLTQLTREEYYVIFDAFRRGNTYRGLVAELSKLGIGSGKVRTAWFGGKRLTFLGLSPVRQALDEERLAARAKLRHEEEKANAVIPPVPDPPWPNTDAADEERRKIAAREREAARRDAVESRAKEAQAVRGAREIGLALLTNTAKLLTGAAVLGDTLKTALQAGGAIDATRGVRLMGMIAEHGRLSLQTSRLAMEMERVHLGEPTEVLRVESQVMSHEDVARKVALSERALERLRKRGFQVVNGGRSGSGNDNGSDNGGSGGAATG
jgi:hypothetical protein